MTSDQGIERRVRRLENDTESIYEILTEVRTTLAEHTSRLDRIDTTLDGHTATLDAHTATLDAHTATLAEILRRLPEPA